MGSDAAAYGVIVAYAVSGLLCYAVLGALATLVTWTSPSFRAQFGVVWRMWLYGCFGGIAALSIALTAEVYASGHPVSLIWGRLKSANLLFFGPIISSLGGCAAGACLGACRARTNDSQRPGGEPDESG